ncbi:MAG: protein of unknown function YeeE/YedE [Clostridia bacterium]|jgi:hypothetical protein|nr:protein of unknown function YeeE/YedE [Clostridia bacterium]
MVEVSTTTSIRRPARKIKKNQLPYGIILLVVLVGIGIGLAAVSTKVATFWVFGIAFGFTLQRARFCFTASLRDPMLTGSTSLTRAVIIAFVIATIGFTAIQYAAVSKGAPPPGNISPVGIHIVIGATMFGIGMVIAGGCASGTLMRVGEGFAMQMLSLVFFCIGSLWGAHDFGWWKTASISKSKPVFLPDIFGWMGALFIQLIVLGALYILADWFENRKRMKENLENNNSTKG